MISEPSTAAGNLQVHDSPLKVAVEHLRDQPYNPSEDHLKATTLEIVSTLKELLHLHPLYNEQLRSFAGVVGGSLLLPCSLVGSSAPQLGSIRKSLLPHMP